uniref:DUF4211 domain-containing protein n=2 Tax=Caenorhabditis japonica TaxID=281687 RepID=A0A8R1DEI5_CAEJA
MQSMYNNFGQKFDSKVQSTSFPQSHVHVAFPFSALPGNGSATNESTSESMPIANKKNGSIDIEEWMQTICVESLVDPPNKLSVASSSRCSTSLPESSSNDTPNLQFECSSIEENKLSADASATIKNQYLPMTEDAAPTISNCSEAFRMDYDEAHDDLENIFGISLAESDAQSSSLFRHSSQPERGLSPIQFTPPDSPHEELTLDMLFGLPSKSSSPKCAQNSEDVPSQSDNFLKDNSENSFSQNVQESYNNSKSTVVSTQSFAKPKKIPVYKQKSVLLSLEARTSARKEDPNYDEFEFEDDEDFIAEDTSDNKREQDICLKKEPIAKSIYITGQGFKITSKQKDQTFAFPRKQNSKSLQLMNDVHPASVEKFVFTNADSIRLRNDQRMTCSFLKPAQMTDMECSRNGRIFMADKPRLPKFLIRIHRSELKLEDGVNHRKRNKKKQSSNDENSDSDDHSQARRKIRKIYSLQQGFDDFSRISGCTKNIGPNCCEFVAKRLAMFGSADGILPKGTYVVCKTDILKDDCALWRVDNQNLLQKFPPFRQVQTNKRLYRSSSTYSGWCEQISSQYFRVTVKILKQSRSETTIEPEVPFHDLFPATSSEMFRSPRSVFVNNEVEPIANSEILNSTICVSLNTLIESYLYQSFTINHIQSLLQKNDWSYLRSLAEVKQYNRVAESKIYQRIPVENKHRAWIKTYTRLAVTRSSYHSLIKCQICKRKKPRRVIHFFDKTLYDFESLIIEPGSDDSLDDEHQSVVDAISCGRCAMAIEFLHAIRHTQLHLLRSCEDKLEEIGTSEFDISTDKCIETAKSDKLWILKIIQKYCDMWDQVRLQFRDY